MDIFERLRTIQKKGGDKPIKELYGFYHYGQYEAYAIFDVIKPYHMFKKNTKY